MSPKLAAQQVKNDLAEPQKYRIRLHDLVRQETERLVRELGADTFSAKKETVAGKLEEEIARRAARYEALCVVLVAMFIEGCY